MMQRVTKILVLFTLMVTFILPQPTDGQAQTISQPANIRIVKQDKDGILLRLEIPSYALTPETHDGKKYQKLSLPDAGYTTQAGAPQLPVVNALLGIPSGVEVVVEVLETTSQELPSRLRLVPAPTPLPIADEFAAGEYSYPIDTQAYANTQNYPEAIAEIADDGWLRDQRVVRIAIHPFQYRAAMEQVTWHREVLVAIHFNGTPAILPFESITPGDSNPFESLLQGSLLNYDQAIAWRVTRTTSERVQALTKPQDLPTRYKIIVDQDGLYHLTYTDTLTAGIPLSDPRNWELTNLGSTVAITITGQEDGSFDLNDEIIFYGERFRGERYAARYPDEASVFWLLDNCDKTYCPPQIQNYRRDMGQQMEKYTFDNVYWLDIGTTRGVRMAVQDGTPTGLTPTTYYTATAHAELQRRWTTYPVVDTEVWFWESASVSGSATNPMTLTLPVSLSGVASVPVSATVRGAYIATTLSASVNPDHHSGVSFNTPPTVLENVWWDDIGRRAFEANIPANRLVEGTNNLYFTVYPVSGVNQTMYFDWFEVEYPRLFIPVNNELWFTGSQAGAQAFQSGGYSSGQIWALDITNSLTPTLIVNANILGSGSYAITLETPQGSGHSYFLSARPALRAPKSISAYTGPDLYATSNGADYIFITDRAFSTPTQELADYRASQGLRTMVVDINDIYNLFGDGIFNPQAIKNFLRYAYLNWQTPAPQYVLLAGYGHFNFHRYSAGTPPVLPAQTMPPYLTVSDAWQADVDSATQLAAFVGDDMLPDLLIGRVIVDEARQMQAIVDKIIAYEAQEDEAWQQRLIFLADNTPDAAGDFVAQSDEIINNHIPASYNVEKLYLNDYIPPCGTTGTCAPITTAYRNSLNNNGALFVNYMGHGAMLNWATPVIFQSSYTSTLTNAPMFPIVLDMTCLTGYYYYAHPAYRPALAVEMVRHASGGAIASFSPTSRGVSTGHDILTRGFYDAVFQNEVRTLGEAALGGQLRLFSTGYNLDLVNTFVVFGDPALKLPLPTHRPAATAQPTTQEILPGTSVTYTLTITNAGSISDTFSLNASGNAWPVELSTDTVGPLLPGEQASVQAIVRVPWTALQGASDAATLTVTSQGNTYQNVSQSVITSVHITGGVMVTPPNAQVQGFPGETMHFNLQVTNMGDFTDTFTIESEGVWPVSLSPASLEPLAQTDSVMLTVNVLIPESIIFSQTEVTTVTLRSQNDPEITDTAILQTNVNLQRGVDVSPPSAETQGLPGETVYYNLYVTNTGNFFDSFDIETESAWPISVSPNSIPPLAEAEIVGLVVSVQVPVTATFTQTDVATITLRSHSDPSISDSTTLVTEVNIRRGLAASPLAAEQQGLPGEIILYNLLITNTGNLTDTFTIATSGEWPVDLAPTILEQLLPTEMNPLAVQVHIPLTATIGQSEMTTVTLRSQNAPEKSVDVFLNTLVDIRGGIAISPTAMNTQGMPGETLTLTVAITNTGNFTDTFYLEPTGNWPIGLLPEVIGPLSEMATTNLVITVQIPVTATLGQSEVITVTLHSQNDPNITANVTWHIELPGVRKIYLPLIWRGP